MLMYTSSEYLSRSLQFSSMIRFNILDNSKAYGSIKLSLSLYIEKQTVKLHFRGC